MYKLERSSIASRLLSVNASSYDNKERKYTAEDNEVKEEASCYTSQNQANPILAPYFDRILYALTLESCPKPKKGSTTPSTPPQQSLTPQLDLRLWILTQRARQTAIFRQHTRASKNTAWLCVRVLREQCLADPYPSFSRKSDKK